MAGSRQRRFFKAVQSGDAAAVRKAISAGLDPNTTAGSGRTGLMIAARGGHVEVVRALLEVGASVLEADGSGDTALCWAVTPKYVSVAGRWLDRSGIAALNWLFSSSETDAEKEAKTPEQARATAAITEDLIAAGALVRVQNSSGQTPLQLAARTGCTEAAEKIIAAGADVHTVDATGASPITDAAERSHWDIVRSIVIHNPDAVPRQTVGEVLQRAAARNREEIAGMLLDVLPTISAEQAMPVAAWAAAEGHGGLLRRVLKMRPDPEVAAAALHGGAATGHRDIVQTALEFGASPDARTEDGTTILSVARPGALDDLLRAGATPDLVDDRGWTALMYAAGRQDAWAVVRLLGAGASPTATTPEGDSVRDIAAAGASAESAGLLENWDRSWIGDVLRRAEELAERAAVAQPSDDTRGVPVLLAAAELGRVDIISRLVAGGADLEVRGPSGETPLMRAAQWGQVEAMAALLDGGADLLARSDGGETVLMWAGSDAAAKLLILAGADLQARDAAGRTALIGAMSRGTGGPVPIIATPAARVGGDPVGVANVLLAAGADVNAQDRNGRTAMATALDNDRRFLGGAEVQRAIGLLIDYGADVDVPDAAGVTPLMLASGRCDADLLTALLAAGADFSRRNADGKTALDLAAHCGSEAPRKVLAAAARPAGETS